MPGAKIHYKGLGESHTILKQNILEGLINKRGIFESLSKGIEISELNALFDEDAGYFVLSGTTEDKFISIFFRKDPAHGILEEAFVQPLRDFQSLPMDIEYMHLKTSGREEAERSQICAVLSEWLSQDKRDLARAASDLVTFFGQEAEIFVDSLSGLTHGY